VKELQKIEIRKGKQKWRSKKSSKGGKSSKGSKNKSKRGKTSKDKTAVGLDHKLILQTIYIGYE
jgi:hypothetical protein